MNTYDATTCYHIVRGKTPVLVASYTDNLSGNITVSWTLNKKQYGYCVTAVNVGTGNIVTASGANTDKSVSIYITPNTEHVVTVSAHIPGYRTVYDRIESVISVSTYTPEYYFEFDSGTITDFYPTGNPAIYPEVTDIVIPPSINGVAVTNIGAGAFYNQTHITGIVFPDSLQYIRQGGLQGCTGITELVFPDGFLALSEAVLYGCTNLIKITIGAGVAVETHNLSFYAYYDGTAGVWLFVDGIWKLEV